MCGLIGFWQSEAAPAGELSAVVTRMADTLAHRGPDDAGAWTDPAAGLALGFRRLAIVDLTPEGHQPMRSASGRFVLLFNGEIYNFQELRDNLERDHGVRGWHGHSDTEVMLAAFEQWGVEAALKRFVGMFAFVLWDTQLRTLHLARDRMGEKPLYYGWMDGVLLFGSELKALCAHPRFRAATDQDAVALYMRYTCVPAPYSIYFGVSKLLPGTLLSITAEEVRARVRPKPRPYWSLSQAVTDALRNPFHGSFEEAAQELDSLLSRAVSGQMVADVPLGAFLSGGIDSSTVVALMQVQSAKPVKTFTIGFGEDAYNEAVYAKRVAQHLGTEHTELYVSPEQALAVVPNLPMLYDEPFGDSSQIPTFLVSQLARRHVTVSLSGDGGDELFGGYNRYFWGQAVRRSIGWTPPAMRRALAAGMTSISPAMWDGMYDRVCAFLPQRLRYTAAGDKMHKLAGLVSAEDDRTLYQRLISHWPDGVAQRAAGYRIPEGWIAYGTPSALRTLPERMMYLDALGYLPDDILAKVDRAAMGVSLETRMPLLDHRVVEFVWRLPVHMKVRAGRGKKLLRRVLYRYVPRELMQRRKMGFSIPLDSWLRGPLKDWAESLLDEARLKREGFFDPAPIRRRWSEHLSGRRNWQHLLWDVLMFQAWVDRWHGSPNPDIS
jgi:asparagine synthase (glutamine-hydrolysing)